MREHIDAPTCLVIATYEILLEPYRFHITYHNYYSDTGAYMQDVYGSYCKIDDDYLISSRTYPLQQIYHSTVRSTEDAPPAITPYRAMTIAKHIHAELTGTKKVKGRKRT